jgi:DNA-binding Lrp family transcriptional regulator
MRKAYVLIQTLPGKAKTLAEALHGRSEVTAADVVSGPYDVIAVVQGTDAEAVARVILSDMATMDGLKHVTTCLVIGRKSEQGNAGCG